MYLASVRRALDSDHTLNWISTKRSEMTFCFFGAASLDHGYNRILGGGGDFLIPDS